MDCPAADSCQPLESSTQSRTYSCLKDALQAVDDGEYVDPTQLDLLARKSQGSFECEFCFGDESNLHRYFKSCQKNPGHEDFIPLGELSLDHLPEGCRYQDCFELIHCQAALTVKLTTSYMSADRPACYEGRGRRCPQKATGFVMFAMKYNSKQGEGSCKCPDCANSDHPKRSWYQLEIMTASHVVFDQSEADSVKIEFSYYSDGTTGEKIVKTYSGKCFHSDFSRDVCKLTLYSHDNELYLKLNKCLLEVYKFTTQNMSSPRNMALGDWALIVSHPHGMEKHVSFGKIQTEIPNGMLFDYDDTPGPKSLFTLPVSPRKEEIYLPLTYTTATCPGSSGAKVYLWSPAQRVMIFTHSGSHDDTYNKSGLGFPAGDTTSFAKTGQLCTPAPHTSRELYWSKFF